MVDRSWEIDMRNKRPNFDEFFMFLTIMMSIRSACLRRTLGALLVKNNRIIATGYNGPAKGIKHCNPCKRDELGVRSGTYGQLADCVSVHAETNCINQLAAYGGTPAEGATIYVMTFPCLNCMKNVVNSGIKKVVYLKDYNSPETKSLAEEAGIELVQYTGRSMKELLDYSIELQKDLFQEKKLCIGIAALARGGKDSFAARLKNQFAFEQLNLSDVLKEELVRQGKEPTKMNMSILGDEWRNLYGYDIVLIKTLEKGKDQKRLVITGIRSVEEVEHLKKNHPNFILITVNTSQFNRFARRKESDPQTQEEFMARDRRDIENKGLGKVIEMTDHTIDNDGTMAEFEQKIDTLIKPLL